MNLPDVGDIVWVDLSDSRGTEQSGRRPALILTSQSFHTKSRRSIICPITKKLRNWPTNVILPSGLRTEGEVMIDQIRSIDRAERMFDIIERVPTQVVQDARVKLALLLGIDFASFFLDTKTSSLRDH